MIKLDFSEIIDLEREFEELPSILEDSLAQGAVIAGAEIQKEARVNAAIDTGELRKSIENSSSGSSQGYMIEVGPTQPYGKEIEFGRPPGTYVSPASLERWAKRKGLNPYAVSKSILKKGSPAQPFMYPALDKKEDSVVSILAQAVYNAFSKALKLK